MARFPFPLRLQVAAAALLALILSGLVAASLSAQSAAGEEPDPSDGGALLLHQKGVATQLPAVRLGTDVKAVVSGTVARVTVTQAFRNTSDRWMEATYLYPLPDDGAVDSLKMVVGDRIFIGRIKEREEARQAYEKALEEGRQAGLVEQARPNMFRSNVANVGPGQTVLIAIEFQAPVRQQGDEFALRLPLVVGSRYVPPHTLVDGQGRIKGTALADAEAVTAPLAHPDLGKSLNPVSISVELAPGFAPEGIASPYHRIDIADGKGDARIVSLAEGEVPADRDFELRWRAPAAQPALGLFRQEHDGLTYVMATVTPPAAVKPDTATPREMIFVIDNSGSMGGESMEAAKASLLYALDTLRPRDRFNIIRFDDTMTQLFDDAVPAGATEIATAKRFTQRLDAAGGTEMLPALEAALVNPQSEDKRRLRQVVFLTDGDLSNEDEMMAEIVAHRGRSRVFMVGIGSAPNNYLMRRMAETGRGTYTNIGTSGEVSTRMHDLLDRLSTPVAQDLKLAIDGDPLEFAPRELPDLYAGEPLVLLGRARTVSGTLTVSGMLAGKPWSRSIDLSHAADSEAVAKLWARRRIEEIEAQRWTDELDYDEADAAVREVGLQFGIVTSQTSLIAEDETPARPKGARLTREELPLLLPHGWDFDALFGNAANGAAAGEAAQAEGLELPQTAALFAEPLRNGLLLMLAGLVGLALFRRRRELAA